MKNVLMNINDKIFIRKRAVIETVNNELKNIAQIEHSRHRPFENFIASALSVVSLKRKPLLKWNSSMIGNKLYSELYRTHIYGYYTISIHHSNVKSPIHQAFTYALLRPIATRQELFQKRLDILKKTL